ncbi:MAG: reverse transcriptase family protein [Lachnospiraceae bacterium]|nr:reverse transcriptase family protein [Lachnospiraceae bacterium]
MWKYCKDEEVIRSFHLTDGIRCKEGKELQTLFTVSNHAEEHYHIEYIPKKKGGRRKLLVPDALLGRIQKNILQNVLAERKVSSYAKAYVKGTGIVENALPHSHAEIILKLDIEDFFENITYLMVYQKAFLEKYFPPAIRTMLAHLCCYNDYLPQGASTSPIISNLVMYSFDEYMGKWCEARKICYTRYSDDLTFSGKFDVKEVKNKVRSFLEKMGFSLNEKKTKVLKPYQRQTVTGIVVNEKPNVSKEYKSQLRQEIYYCEKYGVAEHLYRKRICEKEETTYLKELLGKINYVLQINPEQPYFQEARKKIKEMLKNRG